MGCILFGDFKQIIYLSRKSISSFTLFFNNVIPHEDYAQSHAKLTSTLYRAAVTKLKINK